MRPRFVVGLTLLPLSVAGWTLSIGFDLNGRQYDAWARSSGLIAVTLMLLGLGAFVAAGWEPAPRAVGSRPAAAAPAGLAVFGICLAITLGRFQDGYTGSLVWPELLAWLGAGALPAAVVTLPTAMTPGRRKHVGGGPR